MINRLGFIHYSRCRLANLREWEMRRCLETQLLHWLLTDSGIGLRCKVAIKSCGIPRAPMLKWHMIDVCQVQLLSVFLLNQLLSSHTKGCERPSLLRETIATNNIWDLTEARCGPLHYISGHYKHRLMLLSLDIRIRWKTLRALFSILTRWWSLKPQCHHRLILLVFAISNHYWGGKLFCLKLLKSRIISDWVFGFFSF